MTGDPTRDDRATPHDFNSPPSSDYDAEREVREAKAAARDQREAPKARYKLKLAITGNTLDEIERELVAQTRGGFLIDSDYYKRDSWTVYGGRRTSIMEHVNPEMTPERYAAELDEWSAQRRADRERKAD